MKWIKLQKIHKAKWNGVEIEKQPLKKRCVCVMFDDLEDLHNFIFFPVFLHHDNHKNCSKWSECKLHEHECILFAIITVAQKIYWTRTLMLIAFCNLMPIGIERAVEEMRTNRFWLHKTYVLNNIHKLWSLSPMEFAFAAQLHSTLNYGFLRYFQLFCLFEFVVCCYLCFSVLSFFTSCSLCVVCNLTCLVIASASFLTCRQNALWMWLKRFKLLALQLVYLRDSWMSACISYMYTNMVCWRWCTCIWVVCCWCTIFVLFCSCYCC